MVGGPQTIALVPDSMVLAHGTGEEDFIHLQQEVGQTIQICGIHQLHVPKVHQSSETNRQGKDSIIQTIFQNKAREVNRLWVGNIGLAFLINFQNSQYLGPHLLPTKQSPAAHARKTITDGKSPEPYLSESPVLSFEDSEESQPFDIETWSKEKITQIRELENTESPQTP